MGIGPRTAPRFDQRFTTWKEIAAYLQRDVRTVQRWEAARGLPVHRLPGVGRSPIYALKSELDDWWLNSPARLESPLEIAPAKPLLRRWPPLAAASIAVVVVAAGILLQRREAPIPLPVAPLTSLPGAELAPALSPDGKRLAFTWRKADSANQDIYVMELPDGEPRRLTDDPRVDIFAEWSPDGRRIAYCRVYPGGDRLELRLVELGTGVDRLLLTNEIPGTVDAPPWFHIWTPDGDGLILSRPRWPGGPLGLVLFRWKTGVEERLTPPVAEVVGEITPAVSPSGLHLVFQRRSPSGEGDLFLVELDPISKAATGPPRRITHESCCLDAPSWTRDGKEIVFVTWKGGTRRLARTPASGGSVRFDASVPVVGMAPRIAPDGRLVFHDSAMTGSILRLDLRQPGAGAKPLIVSSRQDGSPAYSSDGKRIVFVSDRRGSRQLWLSDAEGGDVRQLTRRDEVSAWYPAYSPDGKWIAFEGRTGSESRIYLANPSSGESHPLLPGNSPGQRPRWSRSGRHIYFSADKGGQFVIWRAEVSADGKAGAATRFTDLGGYAGHESADGRFFYYSDFTFRQLRRIPTAGGKDEPVDCGTPFSRYPANFVAGQRGLYYAGQMGPRGAPLWFLPYGASPSLVATSPWEPSLLGMAVSPDDHWLLLSSFQRKNGDILAVTGLR